MIYLLIVYKLSVFKKEFFDTKNVTNYLDKLKVNY